MSDPLKFFIEPMLQVFEKPPGSDESAFFRALAGDLSGFSDSALTAGVKTLRETRKYRSFPTVAECLEAVRTSVSRSQPDHVPVDSQNSRNTDEWDTKLEAFRLCRSQMGHRAKAEDWLVACYDFCVSNGRLPESRNEIEFCQWQADESRRGIESNRGTPLYASLKILRSNMRARREKEIFGQMN